MTADSPIHNPEDKNASDAAASTDRTAASTVTMEQLPLTMWDESTSTLRLFSPLNQKSSASTDENSRPLVVIWPGWGVGARYYDPIARELASRGFPVVTGELHGQGSSTAEASKKHRFGYHHMASGDFPDTIRAAKKHFNLPEDHPTYLLCHSMGGQVASLFLAREEATTLGVRGMMGVGAGSPHWRGFEGKAAARLRWGTSWMWLMVKIFGYQPAGRLDLAGYGRQSGAHFSEWHRYVHTNRLHKLEDQDLDYEAAKLGISVPVLLTRFSNDADCTLESCRNLAKSLPSGVVEVEELPETLGHNRWAREPQRISDRFEAFVRG
ncbi:MULTISPECIES: alpha/beta fold hydrolase [Corynebacterium]|nr:MULTISPECIES: alpha/beta fold hydrolase [Corynebacterium]